MIMETLGCSDVVAVLQCFLQLHYFVPSKEEVAKCSNDKLIMEQISVIIYYQIARLTPFPLPYSQAVRPSGCLPMLVFVNSKSGDNQVGECHYELITKINKEL